MIIPILVALCIGAAIALQATVVGRMTETLHPLAVSLSLLVSGLVVASVWASLRQAWPQALTVAVQWWWVPLGAVGWGIVAALGWTVTRLGVATALAVVVGSQLTVAIIVDLVRGSATIGWRNVAGAALVVIGATLLRTSVPDG